MNHENPVNFPVQTEQLPPDLEAAPPNPAELPPTFEHPLAHVADEIIARSQDPHLKQLATERNTSITAEAIWQPGALHHATKAGTLGKILKQGHLAVQRDTPEGTFGPPITAMGDTSLYFGVPRQDLTPDAGHKDQIDNLTYSRYGTADVYVHYLRPAGSYREGQEKEAGQALLMPGGMPSTEINAISMCRPANVMGSPESLDSVRDSIVEAGFFIPVFAEDGEVAYSREDYDADQQAVEAGTYVSRTAQRQEAEVALARERSIAEAQKQVALELAAAEAGQTVDEYQRAQWQQFDDGSGSPL